MEKRRRGPQAQRPYVCCISLALDVTNFSLALLPCIYIFSSNEIAVVCVFFLMKLFLLSVICTAAINKWRELERKAVLKKEQQLPPTPNSPDTVQKAVD